MHSMTQNKLSKIIMRLKIALPMFGVSILLWTGAYIIFGEGDVTAVLMILPSLPLMIIGSCVLSGVFDFDQENKFKDRLRELERDT